MITNLVAAVTVAFATNTTEHVKTRWPDMPYPKEKYVTNSVVERQTITFDFQGKEYFVFADKPVTNWVDKFETEPERWSPSATAPKP